MFKYCFCAVLVLIGDEIVQIHASQADDSSLSSIDGNLGNQDAVKSHPIPPLYKRFDFWSVFIGTLTICGSMLSFWFGLGLKVITWSSAIGAAMITTGAVHHIATSSGSSQVTTELVPELKTSQAHLSLRGSGSLVGHGTIGDGIRTSLSQESSEAASPAMSPPGTPAGSPPPPPHSTPVHSAVSLKSPLLAPPPPELSSFRRLRAQPIKTAIRIPTKITLLPSLKPLPVPPIRNPSPPRSPSSLIQPSHAGSINGSFEQDLTGFDLATSWHSSNSESLSDITSRESSVSSESEGSRNYRVQDQFEFYGAGAEGSLRGLGNRWSESEIKSMDNLSEEDAESDNESFTLRSSTLAHNRVQTNSVTEFPLTDRTHNRSTGSPPIHRRSVKGSTEKTASTSVTEQGGRSVGSIRLDHHSTASSSGASMSVSNQGRLAGGEGAIGSIPHRGQLLNKSPNKQAKATSLEVLAPPPLAIIPSSTAVLNQSTTSLANLSQDDQSKISGARLLFDNVGIALSKPEELRVVPNIASSTPSDGANVSSGHARAVSSSSDPRNNVESSSDAFIGNSDPINRPSLINDDDSGKSKRSQSHDGNYSGDAVSAEESARESDVSSGDDTSSVQGSDSGSEHVELESLSQLGGSNGTRREALKLQETTPAIRERTHLESGLVADLNSNSDLSNVQLEDEDADSSEHSEGHEHSKDDENSQSGSNELDDQLHLQSQLLVEVKHLADKFLKSSHCDSGTLQRYKAQADVFQTDHQSIEAPAFRAHVLCEVMELHLNAVAHLQSAASVLDSDIGEGGGQDLSLSGLPSITKDTLNLAIRLAEEMKVGTLAKLQKELLAPIRDRLIRLSKQPEQSAENSSAEIPELSEPAKKFLREAGIWYEKWISRNELVTQNADDSLFYEFDRVVDEAAIWALIFRVDASSGMSLLAMDYYTFQFELLTRLKKKFETVCDSDCEKEILELGTVDLSDISKLRLRYYQEKTDLAASLYKNPETRAAAVITAYNLFNEFNILTDNPNKGYDPELIGLLSKQAPLSEDDIKTVKSMAQSLDDLNKVCIAQVLSAYTQFNSIGALFKKAVATPRQDTNIHGELYEAGGILKRTLEIVRGARMYEASRHINDLVLQADLQIHAVSGIIHQQIVCPEEIEKSEVFKLLVVAFKMKKYFPKFDSTAFLNLPQRETLDTLCFGKVFETLANYVANTHAPGDDYDDDTDDEESTDSTEEAVSKTAPISNQLKPEEHERQVLTEVMLFAKSVTDSTPITDDFEREVIRLKNQAYLFQTELSAGSVETPAFRAQVICDVLELRVWAYKQEDISIRADVIVSDESESDVSAASDLIQTDNLKSIVDELLELTVSFAEDLKGEQLKNVQDFVIPFFADKFGESRGEASDGLNKLLADPINLVKKLFNIFSVFSDQADEAIRLVNDKFPDFDLISDSLYQSMTALDNLKIMVISQKLRALGLSIEAPDSIAAQLGILFMDSAVKKEKTLLSIFASVEPHDWFTLNAPDMITETSRENATERVEYSKRLLQGKANVQALVVLNPLISDLKGPDPFQLDHGIKQCPVEYNDRGLLNFLKRDFLSMVTNQSSDLRNDFSKSFSESDEVEMFDLLKAEYSENFRLPKGVSKGCKSRLTNSMILTIEGIVLIRHLAEERIYVKLQISRDVRDYGLILSVIEFREDAERYFKQLLRTSEDDEFTQGMFTCAKDILNYTRSLELESLD